MNKKTKKKAKRITKLVQLRVRTGVVSGNRCFDDCANICYPDDMFCKAACILDCASPQKININA